MLLCLREAPDGATGHSTHDVWGAHCVLERPRVHEPTTVPRAVWERGLKRSTLLCHIGGKGEAHVRLHRAAGPMQVPGMTPYALDSEIVAITVSVGHVLPAAASSRCARLCRRVTTP